MFLDTLNDGNNTNFLSTFVEETLEGFFRPTWQYFAEPLSTASYTGDIREAKEQRDHLRK